MTISECYFNESKVRLDKGVDKWHHVQAMLQLHELYKKILGSFSATRTIAIALNLVLITYVMVVPLWTPKNDFIHVYSGLEVMARFPVILILPLINILALMPLLKTTQYHNRKVRLGLLGLSIIYIFAVFGGNALFFNQSDSPAPSNWALAGITLLPIALIIASAIGVGKNGLKAKTELKLLPPKPTRGPSNEFGPNPITGLVRGIAALRRNWQTIGALILALILLAVLQHYADINWARRSPNALPRILVLLAVFGIVGSLIHTMVLAVAAVSAQGKNIDLTEGVKFGWKKFPALAAVLIFQSLMTALGSVLFVVPGIIIFFRLALSPTLVISRDLSAWEAIKLSNRLMKKGALQLMGPTAMVGFMVIAALVVELSLGIWGLVVVNGAFSIIGAGMFVYFVRLADQLYDTKMDGYSRLRVNAANIWLTIAGTLGVVLLPIGILVWAGVNNVEANKTYDTACFRVTVPKSYVVHSSAADCEATASDGNTTYRFKPVVDSARNISQLTKDQESKLFPSSRYRSIPGFSYSTVDGEDAKTFQYWDTQEEIQATAIFVHTRDGHKANGHAVHNFVLIDEPTPEQTNASPSLEGMINPTILADSVLWPPYGSNDYRLQLNKAIYAWNAGDYNRSAALGVQAAGLADNDQARAEAFAEIGDANYQEHKVIPAQSAYQEALSLDPSNSVALRGLANVYYDGGAYDKTVSYASSALAQDDTDAQSYNLRALGYDGLGKHADALIDIERSLALDPGNQQYQQNLQFILNPTLDRSTHAGHLPTT